MNDPINEPTLVEQLFERALETQRAPTRTNEQEAELARQHREYVEKWKQEHSTREVWDAKTKTLKREPLGLLDLAENSARSISSNWIIMDVLPQVTEPTDPNFRWTAKLYDEVAAPLPAQYQTAIVEKAKSATHARRLSREYRAAIDRQNELAAAGLTGSMVFMATQILDPANVAIGGASAKMTSTFIQASRLGRLGRAARAGLVNIPQNLAIDIPRAISDPSYDSRDVAASAFGAFAFGFGHGAIFDPMRPAAIRAVKQIELDTIKEAGLELTEKGKKYYKDVLVESNATSPTMYELNEWVTGNEAGLKRYLVGAGFDEARVEKMAPDERILLAGNSDMRADALSGSGKIYRPSSVESNLPVGVGAHELDPTKFAAQAIEQQLRDEGASATDWLWESIKRATDAPPKYGAVRFGISAQLSKAAKYSRTLSRMGRALVQDLPTDKDGNVQGLSATEIIDLRMRRANAELQYEAIPALNEWKRARGVSLINGPKAEREFWAEVTKAWRREPGTYSNDPHINKAADFLRKAMAEDVKEAQRAGVKGYDRIDLNDTYVQRATSRPSVDTFMAEASKIGRGVGRANLERAVEAAIRAKSAPGVSDKTISAIARAWIDNLFAIPALGHVNHALTLDRKETLAAILRRNAIPEDEIRSIIGAAVNDADTGLIARAKRRIDMDETVRVPLLDANGKQVGDRTVGIEDFLEKDAQHLYLSYRRELYGAIAEAKTLEAFATIDEATGQIVRPSWSGILDQIRREAGDVSGPEAKSLERDLKALDVVHESMLGHPIGDVDARTRKWLGAFRALNHMRLGGKLGFAQISEIGNSLGQAGWSAYAKSVPAIRNILSRAKDGKLTSVELAENEAIIAVGMDSLNGASRRFDTIGGELVEKDMALLGRGVQLTNKLSGMNLINDTSQRCTAESLKQKMAEYVFSGRPPSKERLAFFGLTEDRFARVAAEMKKNAETVTGEHTGARVRKLNLEKWDAEVAADFVVAMDKSANRVIQRNNIGQMMPWMLGPIGRAVLQFRSFNVASWEKQFLTGVATFDATTAQAWALSTLFGGMSYVGLSYVQSIGRDDMSDYLAKRLTPQRIGAASFARAGYAAMFPGPMDSVLQFTGHDPWFSYTRTSGTPTNLFSGIPTFNLAETAYSAGRAVFAPPSAQYQFSQQDYRNILQLMPFNNLMVVQNATNALLGELQLPKTSNVPERSQ